MTKRKAMADAEASTPIEFTATIATDQPDLSGEMFSSEALGRIETGIDLPLTLNFDRSSTIGRVRVTHYQAGKLHASGEIHSLSASIKRVKLYAVPEGKIKNIHMEDGIKVIDDFSISGISLTDMPADPSLPPIQLEE